jgi:uncharacterized membrane protein
MTTKKKIFDVWKYFLMYTKLMSSKELPNFFIILIVSLVLVVDLFLHSGRSITYDGHIHMTTMAQFSQSLSDREFPVAWSNNFANFGTPLPLFAHQLPAYIGALLIILGLRVVDAYNLTLLAAVLIGNFLFYYFLRKSFDTKMAITGVFVYSFFAYRIINVYIRGALPEILAVGLFPLTLIAIDLIAENRKKIGVIILSISLAFLGLIHPMMLVVFAPISIAYFIFKNYNQNIIKQIFFAGAGALLGLMLASYYLVPLILEAKYLYQGFSASEVQADKFLQVENVINSQWPYYFTHPGPRGHYIQLGAIELIILILGVICGLWVVFRKKLALSRNLIFWLCASIVTILMMLPLSKPLYDVLPGFNQLQYPWRFLNVLNFTVPLLLLYTLNKFSKSNKNILYIIIIIIILMARVPQLYGKNYLETEDGIYHFTQANLHSQNLNPVWSGNPEDYLKKSKQTEIISGNGNINNKIEKNASRTYSVSGQEKLRIVDYTFYFPGWKVFIDGKETPIEFQDPNYRGLITYWVPEGSHEVSVKYGDTKVRAISKILSLAGISILSTLIFTFIKKPRIAKKSYDS